MQSLWKQLLLRQDPEPYYNILVPEMENFAPWYLLSLCSKQVQSITNVDSDHLTSLPSLCGPPLFPACELENQGLLSGGPSFDAITFLVIYVCNLKKTCNCFHKVNIMLCYTNTMLQ